MISLIHLFVKLLLRKHFAAASHLIIVLATPFVGLLWWLIAHVKIVLFRLSLKSGHVDPKVVGMLAA